jgi:hypothetical protein
VEHITTLGLGGALLVAVGVALVRNLRDSAESRRLRRELKATPLLGADSREGTRVRVNGVVRPIEVLTAPLSGRSCVMYEARAVDRSIRRPALPSLVAASIRPFLVERDDGESVLIEGQAMVELPPVDVSDADRKNRFLLSNGHPTRDPRPWRFEEVVVESGTHVSIAGLLTLASLEQPSSAERGFREAQAAQQLLSGTPAHPLIIGRGD